MISPAPNDLEGAAFACTGYLEAGLVRARTEDFELWGGHELLFCRVSLQLSQLLVVFRGAILGPHRVAHEDHAEADTSTTNPDAIRTGGETTSSGEIQSYDGHSGPVAFP